MILESTKSPLPFMHYTSEKQKKIVQVQLIKIYNICFFSKGSDQEKILQSNNLFGYG